MHEFDALRDLSERHGLRARNLRRSGQHAFGQRAGTTTFVAREQANPLLTLRMRPVVDRLPADAKLGGNLGQLDPASEQQHACVPGARVPMFVVHGQLLQRLILDFGQFYDTLHR